MPMADQRIVVQVPDARDWAAAVGFSVDLQGYGAAKEIAFDFASVTFATPGWMLLMAKTLRHFRAQHPTIKCRAIGRNSTAAIRYAAHAGFFDAFGVKWGQSSGAAASTEAFLPITNVQISELTANAPAYAHHGEILQDEAERLASVLTRSSISSSEAVETLAYAIREITRNVVEHSGADHYRFAAQWWPTSGHAEIAIEDDGKGLAASFRESGRHIVADDAEALKLAVTPGVTSAFVSKHSTDEWANSGFGLYMTRGLCGQNGRFTLTSNSATLVAEGGAERIVASYVPGTLVVLRLNVIGERLSNRLAALRSAAPSLKPSRASLVGRMKPRKG